MRIGSFTVTTHADNLVPKDDSYDMLGEQLPIIAGEAINSFWSRNCRIVLSLEEARELSCEAEILSNWIKKFFVICIKNDLTLSKRLDCRYRIFIAIL